jgi:hypothetical protein
MSDDNAHAAPETHELREADAPQDHSAAPQEVHEAKPGTVTVGSTLPMALRISEPPNVLPDDSPFPGTVPEVAHVVINGGRHESAVGGVSLTHDVPEDMIRSYLDRHPHLNDFVRVMSPDDVAAHGDLHASYGYPETSFSPSAPKANDPNVPPTEDPNKVLGLNPHPDAPPPEAA